MEKIEVLVKECEITGKRLYDLILLSEKIIGLGITVIIAGMVYGIKENIMPVFLLLPILINYVTLYGVIMFGEALALGGYKRHLEEKINTTFGENVLLWEIFIAKYRHHAFGTKFIIVTYGLYYLVIVGFSLRKTWRHYPRGIFLIAIAIALFLAIGLIISFSKMKKTFDKTYQICKTSSKSDGSHTQ